MSARDPDDVWRSLASAEPPEPDIPTRRRRGVSGHLAPGFNPITGDTIDEPAPPELLPMLDAGDLEGQPVPPREWMVEGWEPRGTCVYLTGIGASGKSLLSQQRMTCSALGLPFLGAETRQGVSIYVTCEDDVKELHRRQDAINRALGITWADLRGKLFLVSLKGQLNKELAIFDSEGRMRTTPRWQSVQHSVCVTGATHVVLDNVAHLFAGNENIRNQVAAFVGLLDGLAENIGGVVLLLGHPNKAGAEYSGSTAWENQVRARLYLALDADDDGIVADPEARLLTNSKPNYARRGAAIHFRWHDWAFVRDCDLPANTGAELAAAAEAARDNALFLACLDERNRQERAVSERAAAGKTYAPKVFAEMPESKRIGRARLEAAMERLFRIGAIERGKVGRHKGEGKDMFGIRRRSDDLSDDLPMAPSDDVPMTSRQRPTAHTLVLRTTGAATEAAAPDAKGMILAPGEPDDDVPGWEA